MEDTLALADELFGHTTSAAPLTLPQPTIDLALDDQEAHTVEDVSAAAVAVPGAAELGQAFIDWARHGVLSHKLVINDAKAMIHTVDGTAFLVSPGLFKRYALEHPHLQKEAKERDIDPWQLVQRAFEKLKINRKTADNLNIWTCEVIGPRKSKSLKGYLLQDPTSIFAQPPFDNPSIKLQVTEAEQ